LAPKLIIVKENASKASIHLRNLRDLREKFLEFMALEEICKSFTAEFAEEYAEFAMKYFEALCFIENAEFNDPVFVPMNETLKIQLYKIRE
jgi:hypothetical protein